MLFGPAVREEVAEGFGLGAVGHVSHAVEQVGEVLEEVDLVESAGAGQGVEDAPSLGSGVASEEQRVFPGE